MLQLKITKGLVFVAIAVLVVTLSYAAVVFADVYIYGGENQVYDGQISTPVDGEFSGNVTATGGICTGLGDPDATMCNIDINYLDVTTALSIEGTLTAEATSTWAVSEDGFTKRLAIPSATSSILVLLTENMTDTYLRNDWGQSICERPYVNFLTASDDLGIYYDIGTSTPTSTDSITTTSTASLISSFQTATGTIDIFTVVKYPGTFWQLTGFADLTGNVAASSTDLWIWEVGDAVNMRATSTLVTASATPFAEYTGFVDIPCRLTSTETSE